MGERTRDTSDKNLKDYYRPFPGGPLLERERKVKHRKRKEKIRMGLKDQKQTIETSLDPKILKYLDKIYCGDSEKILKTFPDSFVDIIITSPPYNFGQEYKGTQGESISDAIKWESYFDKLNRIWIECIRVLKPGGRMCINIQPVFSDYIPTHHMISNQLLNLKLLWKGEILWEKHNYSCKYTCWGSWCAPSMPYLKYTWEFIEVFCKDTHKKTGDPTKIDISGDEFKKWVYAKWDIAPETRMMKYDHPAVFPEEIPHRLLKLFSYVDDVVLDPFVGIGTTALVAEKLNRQWIGIEISKKYCDITRQRIKEYQNSKNW